ncbi:MAG: hypothetical protein M0022_06285 [Desulfobacteraceae bacterium]|nr:hypothetical protein [Desulfobacteraceae bacterium]
MTVIMKDKAVVCQDKKFDFIRPETTQRLYRRIICPACGNDRHFYEVAEDVVITTRYIQNADGSFTPQSDESRILGEIRLYCVECDTDLSQFHDRFMEMLF